MRIQHLFLTHFICKIHHDKTQCIDETELMFNNPLKWHPLHQEVDGSAPKKKKKTYQ